jgi:hypothetical protein
MKILHRHQSKILHRHRNIHRHHRLHQFQMLLLHQFQAFRYLMDSNHPIGFHFLQLIEFHLLLVLNLKLSCIQLRPLIHHPHHRHRLGWCNNYKQRHRHRLQSTVVTTMLQLMFEYLKHLHRRHQRNHSYTHQIRHHSTHRHQLLRMYQYHLDLQHKSREFELVS